MPYDETLKKFLKSWDDLEFLCCPHCVNWKECGHKDIECHIAMATLAKKMEVKGAYKQRIQQDV